MATVNTMTITNRLQVFIGDGWDQVVFRSLSFLSAGARFDEFAEVLAGRDDPRGASNAWRPERTASTRSRWSSGRRT